VSFFLKYNLISRSSFLFSHCPSSASNILLSHLCCICYTSVYIKPSLQVGSNDIFFDISYLFEWSCFHFPMSTLHWRHLDCRDRTLAPIPIALSLPLLSLPPGQGNHQITAHHWTLAVKDGLVLAVYCSSLVRPYIQYWVQPLGLRSCLYRSTLPAARQWTIPPGTGHSRVTPLQTSVKASRTFAECYASCR
jgi:hypothetical protein